MAVKKTIELEEKYIRQGPPKTLAEVTLCAEELLMQDAIFGNAITPRIEELRKRFVSAIKEQYGEFPDSDFEKYELKGEALSIANQIWFEAKREKPLPEP